MLSSRLVQSSRPAASWLRQAATHAPRAQGLRQPMARRMMSSGAPAEDQVAHTISGRIMKWAKSLPVEVYPLFVIMASSLSFGIYSMILPVKNDGSLRLKRSAPNGSHNTPLGWRSVIDESE